MGLLNKCRAYLSDWQAQGFAEKPYWYDEAIDGRINAMNNVELPESTSIAEECE